MILKTAATTPATRDEVCPSRSRAPTLWSALRTDVQGQLAFAWANLILEARHQGSKPWGGEHGRNR